MIDPARERTHDADNPPSQDELDAIEREMDEIAEEVASPDFTLDSGANVDSTAMQTPAPAPLNLPDLN